MSEKELKLTDLDYATGDHHLQMVKAALPYLDIGRQRNLSMFVKAARFNSSIIFFLSHSSSISYTLFPSMTSLPIFFHPDSVRSCTISFHLRLFTVILFRNFFHCEPGEAVLSQLLFTGRNFLN